jgi:iron(II)-dependent oxidoreductase
MDMAGNAWEWVNDWYLSNYYDSSPYSNPPGPASGTYKIVHSGGWANTWPYVRVANRGYRTPSSSDYFPSVGFRCAVDAPGE